MDNNYKTLVFGASLKEERYSNKAINRLRDHQYPVVAIGGREGEVLDVTILKGHPDLEDIHTITMYMGAARQSDHYEYLLGLNPTRIIFNPGAENQELSDLARKAGIETINACTLVMLSTGQYELKLDALNPHA